MMCAGGCASVPGAERMMAGEVLSDLARSDRSLACDQLRPLLRQITWTEADADAVSEPLARSLGVIDELKWQCE